MTGAPVPDTEDTDLLDAVAQVFAKARPDPAAPLSVGVAVSGGGDSMALLHLLHRLAPSEGYLLHAVTVDHGLRPEAADEAAGVAAFCARQGVAHEILRWRGPQETGNLMDQARRARLCLIADWAVARGVGHVALGHTADDQAESFLMNLSRAAGLDGLSGMRRGWLEHGIRWYRPLLQKRREVLRDYLRRNSVTWIDDPSNENDRFTRVKARRALRALKPLGITVERLLASTQHLFDARSALQMALAQAVETHVTERAGALHLSADGLCALGAELERRLLSHAIRWMNGAGYPPRAEQLLRLMSTLHDHRDATLGGVRFRWRQETLVISREPRAVMGPVPAAQLWDHRWRVVGPLAEGQTLAALGVAGLRQCPGWRDLASREALIVSPAVWQGDRLIAAPLARPEPDWGATLGPSFGMFILAH
ncbi:tRNA(Ile)-lysidine synthase [Gemmobacter caeni]|uniref:tRNA(Ile)-lysidine synthase n=1 Tax=Gemmobacter caeni TaxID=589035 RepID=A0A2T6AVX5_9RHOB|nr:tRNA lysidine(34) synthetase TilS [Gemmobacter caeni]PTX47971.1 tRNA(Ile)-lysidine synthase [Gemmobacter caeni]TWI97307.1 tRNA(Ile)-lysidine synthase [Gemmobacter caeni]